MRLTLAFLALFAAYQLPEGVGQPVLLLAFFPLAYIAGRMLSFTAARAYGLEWSRDAAVVTPAFFALAVLLKLGAVAAGLHLAIYQTDTPRTAGVATALSAGLLMTFLPSIAEDILTRGFWFRASGIRWTPWVFVAASSAIYVANHIYRLHLGYGEWLMLATFGVAYALAVMRFQSLWPAVGLHWGWNYGNAVVDTIHPITTMSSSGSRTLSICAHLVMAAVVLAPRGQRRL